MRARSGWVLLFVLSLSMSGCLGPLAHDVTPSPSPGAPIAAFDVLKVGDASFEFDGSASQGRIVNYTWELGDGTRKYGPLVEHAYAYTNGIYTVTLVVKNPLGLLGAASQDVQAGTGENQPPRAAFTASTWRAGLGEPIVLDSSLSVDPDGDPLVFEWHANWPLREAEYRTFRAERGGDMPAPHEHPELIEAERAPHEHDEPAGGGGDDSAGADDHEHDTDAHSTDDGPRLPLPPGVPVPVRPTHGSEKGSSRNAYYEEGGRTAEGHTLLSFPIDGLFYVHLRVYDIKGDYDEEIWPILVEETPPATSMYTNWTGNVTLGAMGNGASLPEGPNGPLHANTTTLRFAYPAPTFVANVTYELHPDDVPYQVRNEVPQKAALELYYNGDLVSSVEDGEGLGWMRLAIGPLEDGAVDVRFVGLQGVDIDFFAEVEATFDTNPFDAKGFLKETH